MTDQSNVGGSHLFIIAMMTITGPIAILAGVLSRFRPGSTPLRGLTWTELGDLFLLAGAVMSVYVVVVVFVLPKLDGGEPRAE